MGRRTWESIPPRFRPLQGRLNLVLTSRPLEAESRPGVGVERATSLTDALEALGARRAAVGRVFVIGGAGAYAAAAALAGGEARRVLLTRILADFDCDVRFPVPLGVDGGEKQRKEEHEGEAGGGSEESQGRFGRWVQCSKEALDRFVGEEVPDGVQVENEVPYQFEMWERVD